MVQYPKIESRGSIGSIILGPFGGPGMSTSSVLKCSVHTSKNMAVSFWGSIVHNNGPTIWGLHSVDIGNLH